ncbi:NB-ARC domain-containing protein [Actinoplanes sp. TRM 88003]|uniref:NB-ARC domain-containing protein n=1 Tax=Paractinoplanes aksuensis TaxID=2939490 RepID=A0ABT1E3Z9_9ACTN|nr:tetratricopeptide repeat protein [Actinoplanes aksuensis]MCO8276850.1 NB-ARC domain-containing protein [Actinoplanes aksuensis]
MRLNELLRQWRLRADLTLEALEEASGVSVRAIGDLERGHSRTPQRRTIQALADVLVADEEELRALLAAAREHRRQRPGPVGLPRVPDDFVGRTEELARLRKPSGTMLISGPAGTGKTMLATQAARALAADFPDGVVFAGLRGMSERSASTDETASRIMSALGVDGRPDPVAYRKLLGEKRALIVLDDVADEEQVRPLLAPGARSMTILTSRRRLAGLAEVSQVQLGLFSPEEAAELLRAIVAEPGFDEEAAADIARLCGYLPLAMRIAGNRLRSRPAWSARDLADRLADEQRRLNRLVAGDVRVDAAFALSYQQLSPVAATVFRRLALVPGPDAGTALAVVAAGLPADQVEDGLDELAELGLLESGDRHQFHDLVRLFARERLAEEEPGADPRELSAWLLDTAKAAGQWFEGGATPDFADADEAAAWLRAEAENWLAALRTGEPRPVVDTAEAMHWFSDYWANWPGWEEVFTLGRDAAHTLGDLSMEATHTNYLAWVHLYRSERDESVRHALAALALAERAGDRAQQGWALNYAAAAERMRTPEAHGYLLRAALIFEELGDYNALCQILLSLSAALRHAGRAAEAVPHLERLLRIADDPTSPMLEAAARQLPAQIRYEMGRTLGETGRVDEALDHLDAAAGMFGSNGQPQNQALSWHAQGIVLLGAGRTDEARTVLRRAESMFEELGLELRLNEVRARLTEVHTDSVGPAE